MDCRKSQDLIKENITSSPTKTESQNIACTTNDYIKSVLGGCAKGMKIVGAIPDDKPNPVLKGMKSFESTASSITKKNISEDDHPNAVALGGCIAGAAIELYEKHKACQSNLTSQEKPIDHTAQLFTGVTEGNTEMVRNAINRGINLNKTFNDKGYSALHVAVWSADFSMVALLLNHGMNIDIRAKQSQATPLLSAAAAGKLEIVKLLIARGANVNVVEKHGLNAKQCAAHNHQQAIVKWLEADKINSIATISHKKNKESIAKPKNVPKETKSKSKSLISHNTFKSSSNNDSQKKIYDSIAAHHKYLEKRAEERARHAKEQEERRKKEEADRKTREEEKQKKQKQEAEHKKWQDDARKKNFQSQINTLQRSGASSCSSSLFRSSGQEGLVITIGRNSASCSFNGKPCGREFNPLMSQIQNRR